MQTRSRHFLPGDPHWCSTVSGLSPSSRCLLGLTLHPVPFLPGIQALLTSHSSFQGPQTLSSRPLDVPIRPPQLLALWIARLMPMTSDLSSNISSLTPRIGQGPSPRPTSQGVNYVGDLI